MDQGLLALLLTLACCAPAQILVSLNPTPLLPDCAAIAVGNLTTGSVEDSGRQITVRATLRVDRVVKGPIEPGSDVRVAWTYIPNPIEGPRAIRSVPTARTLWMLQQSVTPGEFVPAQLSLSNAHYYYLPFPPGELPPPFAYSPSDDPNVKLAHELGFALETLAEKYGDRLNVTRVRSSRGYIITQGNMEQMGFSRAADLFWRIPANHAEPLLRRFAASRLPNLRIVGINGLLMLGDMNALTALARNFGELAFTSESSQTPQSLRGLRVGLTAEGVHARSNRARGGGVAQS